MSELFLSVLNRSLTASYVILFIIIIRLLLKKAPKVISYALWGVVAFRLIIPFSFESMFSLMPRNTNTVPIPHDIIYQQNPKVNSGLDVVDSLVSESLPAPAIGASVNPLQIYIEIGAYFWILGIMILLIYSLVSGILLKRQLRSAELIEQNIFEAKNLKTPFVLGLLRPKIYLPVGFNDKERSYILLHEQTHINRKDHIIKVLAFLVLSVHWFNPFVWIAFMLMSMDMELSCDERVLKEMNEDIKKPYANSLLSLATGRHILNGSPLAFGEGNVKGRIKNVLNYRKPPFWIIVFALAIAAVVSIGLLTNPKKQEPIFNEENSVSYEFIQLVNGEVQHTVSPLSGDNAQLAEDIIMNYMIKSAAWPGMDISTLGECYLLRATYSDGTTSDYYMFLHDGRAVMQWGIDGHYSFIENELYKKILEAVSSGKTAVVGIDDEDKYADDIDLLPGFTDEEVTSARAVVEEYFRSIQEKDREAILKTLTPIYNQPNVVFGDGIRTLLSIDYNEDDPMRKSYVEHGRGSINGTQKEDVIVFRVSFNVKYPKGASGSFNEGDYTNWSMILIREGKESPWLIDDQGY
jgi:beta-lactamase regulating signal transducer with metallopeptidase domain